MKKILFITDRNVLTTSGELRLIKNRAESLYNDSNIVTDFIVFSKPDRIIRQNESIDAGGETVPYEISVNHPFKTLSSCRKVIKQIETRLATDEYGAVVLSGFAMSQLSGKIKRIYDIPVLLDLHGASEDMLILSANNSLKKKLFFRTLYHTDNMIIKNNLIFVDGIFVVTEALEHYVKTRFNVVNDCKFFIIPCGTKGYSFDKEEHLKDRNKYRLKYGIDDKEIVFVYSGGVSPWQCVSETIELYRRIADKLGKKSRMLVFSHNKNEILRLSAGDNRIQVDRYHPDELGHALHVGDFAFLLRDNIITNNVAFPNKYLEYVQSGMRIITTPYVMEIAKQVKENELGFIYDFNTDLDLLEAYVQDTSLTDERIRSINETLEHNSFSTTTKPFCEWYIGYSKPIPIAE